MKKAILFSLMVLSVCTSFSQSVWTQKANFGGGGVTEARAFAIGSFGYIGASLQTFWEYDPVNDTWTQVANFPATPRSSAAGFAIGTKGYFGTGGNYNDFYEYDQATNSWTQKANFGGSAREGAVGIAINGKGYIGTGGSYLNDWWEYDPVSDTWTQKANLAGPTRYHAGAFAINNKGYVCTGFNGSFFNDLWEYDPALNSWTAKAPLPGATRDRPVGIAAAGKGYIVTGWTGNSALNDAWEYDPVTDSWTQLPPFPGVARYNACGFGIGSKIYVGTGSNGSDTFYEYGPSCTVQVNAVASTCFSSCDGAAGVAFPSGSATYLWSNGSTGASITGLCPGSYTVSVTDSLNCTATSSVTVTSPPAITGSAVITEPDCYGDADGGACFIPAGGTPPYTGYQWALGDTTSCISNVPAGLYTITVTDASGCTGINNVVITQPGQIGLTMNGVNATCSTCNNGSATVAVSGGSAPYTYQWSNGASNAFVINLLPGMYTCCVTDDNGCQQCDTVTISFSSGIYTPELFTASITPNPFSTSIKINLNTTSSLPAILNVFDVTGKLVETIEIVEKEFMLPADNYPKGVYFIEIKNNRQVIREKILKL